MPRKRKQHPQHCTECGRERVPIPGRGVTPCPDHPDARLVEMGYGLARAIYYIRHGAPAVGYDPNYWPGVEPGLMALADVYVRRWREHEPIPERRSMDPLLLFGPRTQEDSSETGDHPQSGGRHSG